jgi:hypothetical protein
MTIAAKLDLSLTVADAGAGTFGGVPSWNAQMALLQTLVNGTVAGQADLVYLSERTVAAAANDDIDLTGVLKGALGESVNLVHPVGIFIINAPQSAAAAANTTNLTVGAASANAYSGFVGAATHTVGPIRPGGAFLIFNPDVNALGTVVAGTGDILRVANSAGAPATYQIAILGRSA